MYSEGEGHYGSKLPRGKDSPELQHPYEDPFLQWHEPPEDSLVLILGVLKKNQNYLTTTRNLYKEVGMATWRPFLSPRNFTSQKPYFKIKI